MKSVRKQYNDLDHSILLDSLLLSFNKCQDAVVLDGQCLIAKPFHINTIKGRILRIKAAIRVLRGKSFAVHYGEDV